jgi:hypothetical protein
MHSSRPVAKLRSGMRSWGIPPDSLRPAPVRLHNTRSTTLRAIGTIMAAQAVVRHPHAQEGGDWHEAADDGARTGSDQAQGEERDAPVEAPALDSKRDDEAAHEEEDHVRGVGRQDPVQGRDAQQREGHDRQESGRLDIDRLGEPPSRHPDHQGKRGAPRLRELDPLATDGRILGRKQAVAEQPEQRPAEQAEASDHRSRHEKDPGPGPATCSSLYR